MKTLRAVAIVAAMAIAGGVVAAADPGSANGDTVGAELLAPTSILTATAGLIAFHIGLYTLVGRERKSPYIINSVFLVFLFCIVIAAIALLSTLVPDWLQGSILYTSGALLFVAFLFSAFRVFRITVRFIYFVDSVHPKHIGVIRYIRRRRAMQSPRPNYAHNTIPVPADLKCEIIKCSQIKNGVFNPRKGDTQALAIAVRHQGQAKRRSCRTLGSFLDSRLLCPIPYRFAPSHRIRGLSQAPFGTKQHGLAVCREADRGDRCILSAFCFYRFHLY